MTTDTRQLDLFALDVASDKAGEAAEQQTEGSTLAIPDWIMRDRDLVVRASAGTGKTEALTELYVHWLAGIGGAALKPSEILATTFTEKAAEEMRARIALALSDVVASGGEQERCKTRIARLVCERGHGELDMAHLRLCERELSDAPLGTFHSICVKWLRLYADTLELAPAFDVLTEFEAERLRHDAMTLAVRETVSDNEGVRALLSDFRKVEGDFSLIAVLEPIMLELLEQGRVPPGMWDEPAEEQETPMLTAEAVPLLWRRLIREHRQLAEHDVKGGSKKTYARVADLAETWASHPRAQNPDASLLVQVAFALEASCGTGKVAHELAARRARTMVIDGWARQARAVRREAVRVVVEGALENYRLRKQALGVLDFSDLLLKTRELLSSHAAARRHMRERFKAVMVDEFQDTNTVQRDLVTLLRRGQRGGFVVVGDRKQSIYGFRGADIAVYEGLARTLLEDGAREHVLKRSFRTHASLLEAVNALSEAALGTVESNVTERNVTESHALLPFEMQFEREKEALESARETLTTSPSVALIEPLEEGRRVDHEPVSVARHIASMVRAQTVQVNDNTVPAGSGALRPVRYGDIALLLPRFTKLGDFTRAFDRESVPYRVLKGRGLLTTAEARDVMSLAALLLDLDDGRGLLATLRGPMLQLDETELSALVALEPNLFRTSIASHDWEALLGAERATWMQELLLARRSIDRRGLMPSMERLLELAEYRSIMAALPSGEQRVANVDRICSELWSREYAGESPRDLLRELRVRAERELDPEADVVGVASDAVLIMTVHQSKGLQFPVVVAADLGRQLQVPSDKVLYDRDAPGGVAVSVRGPGSWVDGAHYETVRKVAKARALGEAARLFYVQITRARDHLVLSGLSRSKQSLRVAVVDPVLEALAPELVTKVGIPHAPPSSNNPTAAQSLPVSAAPRPAPRLSPRWEVSVTMLEEFARCPRRFQARSVLGDLYDPLSSGSRSGGPDELGALAAPRDTEAASREPQIDARQRGTLLHSLLERTDWHLAAKEPKAIEAWWKQELRPSGLTSEAETDMLIRMRAFLQSRYARALASEGVRAEREVPFALRFDLERASVVVRGQIDLLVEFADRVHIVDYKATTPEGASPAAPYAFQLAAYALGYHRMRGEQVPAKEVRAGIWFVDGKPRDPIFDDTHVGQAVRDFSEVVARFADTLASQSFAGRKLETCRVLGCPLIRTCHSSAFPAGVNEA